MIERKSEIRDKIINIKDNYKYKAPEFPDSFARLNSDENLTMESLKGKIVLLDFWTYCCINCLHVIPDLKYLEEKYKDSPFVVVGVHSAKFNNESETKNIRQAILRYGIKHPVVVDEEFYIWRSYDIHSWPSFVLVDPLGNIVAVTAGEGNRKVLENYIDEMLEIYKDDLDGEPFVYTPEKESTGKLLDYPGKISTNGELLFISDTNNDRVLVSDKEGNILNIIGSGENGFSDGTFETAKFNRLHGTVWYENKLYIADTKNHAIRVADFNNNTVTTVAGTGKQGGYFKTSGRGTETELNSPWDLTVQDDIIYIAMAGNHTIWRYHTDDGYVERYAGTGRETRLDGGVSTANFAQPSGITSDGKNLYIADSEISSIRKIAVDDNIVKTVAGGDLFDFGDVSGYGDEVRFQHPLGVFSHEGKVYIADTYNHKIKIMDGGYVTDFDNETSYYEPSGLCILDDYLYVADTNNHEIKKVHLKTKESEVFNLNMVSYLENKNKPEPTDIGKYTVSSKGDISVKIDLGEVYKFNEGSPFVYKISSSELDLDKNGERVVTYEPQKEFNIPFNTLKNSGDILVELEYFYCKDDELCSIKQVGYSLKFDVVSDGSNSINIIDKID